MFSGDLLQGLQTFGLALVPALFGIICHEVAHGWVAYKMGDPTAKALGRLTLNPIKHIDPVGLGVLAVTAISPSPVVFGWAKPVPVQSRFFKSPRKGMMLVSVAGPAANLLVALLCALLIKFQINLIEAKVLVNSDIAELVRKSLGMGVGINCVLAWFNLLPIPPLDGSHILGGFLPPHLYRQYAQIGKYGIIIIFLLLLTGVFSYILLPLMKASISIIGAITGLNFVL